jgi:hypothetical protein
MSEETHERQTEVQNPIMPSQAHELCRKAKETLDKANKLLTHSGKQQNPSQRSDEEEKS